MSLRACLRAAFAALLLTALLAGPAQAARLKPTTLVAPAAGAVVSSLPPFSWNPVAGADHYDFEIAADAGFNSPVEGNEADKFATKNTSASLVEAIPNGNYWWRVRAVTKDGSVSPWTKGRTFTMNWVETPKPLSPENEAVVSFPKAATLVWSPVAGAAKYKVLLASDSALGSLVYNRTTVYTQATRFTPEVQLQPGVYYWQITPLDARGHEGQKSETWSFTWNWPATVTGLEVTDLRSEPEVTEPHFTWNKVAGASGYYVEINPSVDWAPSSMVCCGRVTGLTPTYDTLLGTELTPRELFKDNDRYYWRVAAIDAGGKRGPWTEGTPFAKKFDKVPPVVGPAIKNLRMRDATADPANDLSADPGLQTRVPIVRWDPVPGASMYQVDVVPYTMESATVTFPSVGAGTPILVRHSGTSTAATIYSGVTGDVAIANPVTTSGPSTTSFTFYARPGSYDVYVNGVFLTTRTLLEGCDWQAQNPHWESRTAVPYWTPLGDGSPSDRPFNSATGVSTDGEEFTAGAYCVKVRAQSDRAGTTDEVFGDWTYLTGPNGHEAAFIAQTRSIVPCTPTCSPGYMGAGDFLEPSNGANVSRTPLFTWRDIAPSYWIIVARDPNFSNVVDYALTYVPAYAPRQRAGVTTYPDDSVYYWTVLPAQNADGTNAATDVLRSRSSFGKASIPPTLLAQHAAGPPSCGRSEDIVIGIPTYCWTGAEGAREYVLQAAADAGFTKVYEEVVTNSTSYTSTKAYDGDSVFWRVRANDEAGKGLTWSPARTFTRQLPKPVPSATNINVSDGLPTWSWLPADGAQTYDVEITLPDGKKATFDKNYSTASDPTEMTGTGIFHWRVRARFPGGTTAIPGPWSDEQFFTRTIPEPLGPNVVRKGQKGVLLQWQARPGVKSYVVEIARREDFKATIETVHTDATNYAPKMDKKEYDDGGVLYWRVAAKDLKDNVGSFTTIQKINISPRMVVKQTGFLRKGQLTLVKFKVTTFDKKNVYKAFVKAIGKPLKKPLGARTNKAGVVTLRVKPTKKGKVTYTITKNGNQPVTITVDVR